MNYHTSTDVPRYHHSTDINFEEVYTSERCRTRYIDEDNAAITFETLIRLTLFFAGIVHR